MEVSTPDITFLTKRQKKQERRYTGPLIGLGCQIDLGLQDARLALAKIRTRPFSLVLENKVQRRVNGFLAKGKLVDIVKSRVGYSGSGSGHGHKTQKVSNDYVNFPEFAEALARCRRVQEYVKTKKGGGTKEVVDRTVKNRLGPNSKKVSNKENKKVDLTVKSRLGPNPKRVSNKDIEECYAGFMFPNSPDPSALPMPTSLIKKTMGAQLIMV
ncbi:hypothetical protein Tco_0964340 [Tanacetum coccineum]